MREQPTKADSVVVPDEDAADQAVVAIAARSTWISQFIKLT